MAWSFYQKVNFNCYFDTVENRWLSTIGQIHSPKTLSRKYHGNLGLAKIGNNYANGGFVLARSLSTSSKGSQFNISKESKTVNLNVIKPFELFSIQERIGSWIGKYSAFFKVNLYKIAYEKIKFNDKKTLDTISMDWIEKTIFEMKDKSFQFNSLFRKIIPRISKSSRFLSIPTFKDKVIQELYRMILEPLVEPLFKETSHGFRPGKSCHTALKSIRKWTNVVWMIEGNTKGYFDNVNYYVLAKELKKYLKDQNMIELYWKMVKAGYINNERMESHSITGVFQGGILSSLLSNIYLHKLDIFIENLKEKYNSKKKFLIIQNLKYIKTLFLHKKTIKLSNIEKKIKAKLYRKSIANIIKNNKIYYIRYADSWVVGIIGNWEFAVKIKEEIKEFLKIELKLKFDENKIKIKNMIKDEAEFLGTKICRSNERCIKILKTINSKYKRIFNQKIVMYAPINKLLYKLKEQGYIQIKNNKFYPKAQTKWIYLKPEKILNRYNSVISGILKYYSFVNNRNMMSRIVYFLKFSIVFTLARKWNMSSVKVFKKVGNKVGINKKSLILPKNLKKQIMKFDLISKREIKDPFKIF